MQHQQPEPARGQAVERAVTRQFADGVIKVVQPRRANVATPLAAAGPTNVRSELPSTTKSGKCTSIRRLCSPSTWSWQTTDSPSFTSRRGTAPTVRRYPPD